MSHPANSQEQRSRKKNTRGSLQSRTIVRLRDDGGAAFNSPQDVTYEQLGKGNNKFVDLDDARALYPTPAEIPGYLLPSPEVLDRVKNCTGDVVWCPFCPSTFSGVVVKKSFKRHLQRHWNPARAKAKGITDPQSSLAAPPVSLSAQRVPDTKKPSDAPNHSTSNAGVHRSSHASSVSLSTLPVTSTGRVPASDPPISPNRSHTTLVHEAPSTPKATPSNKGRKPIATSTPGPACKDSSMLAIARTMEVLRSKAGTVFNSPDAYSNLEHQSFTEGEERFLDVDATFSMYPTIDELPESFWPSPQQYMAAASGECRIRCLFCSWSFTGLYVKANFRGHVRYHWKLLAATQNVNSSPTNVQPRSTPELQPYAPSPGFTGAKQLIQHDVVGRSKLGTPQPSPLSDIKCTQIDQIATSGSLATNQEPGRTQGKKRSHADAFPEELRGDPSAARSVEGHENSLYLQVLLSIARALSAIRMNPSTSFIPPEQLISYEDLVLVVNRYLDIDKVVAIHPLVDQLPKRFWPSDETFEKVGRKGQLERVRCPFCTWSFQGTSARKDMKFHLECHWLHASGQSGLEKHYGTLADGPKSTDSHPYAWSSRHRISMPVHPSAPPMMQNNIDPEEAQPSVKRIHIDLEPNHSNHGTHAQVKVPRAQGSLRSAFSTGI
jgi:hypothetical protein